MHKIKYIPGTGFMLFKNDGSQIELPIREVIVNDNWSENNINRKNHYEQWTDYYKQKGFSEIASWEKAKNEHPYPGIVKVTFELECIFES